MKTPQKKPTGKWLHPSEDICSPDCYIDKHISLNSYKPTGKAWKPEFQKQYYFLKIEMGDVELGCQFWSADYYDKERIKNHNYFRTRKLALAAAKAMKVLLRNLPHA